MLNQNSKSLFGLILTMTAMLPLSGQATVAVTAVSSTGKELTNYYNGSYVYSAYSSAQPGVVVPPASGDNVPVDFAADASPAAGVGTGNPGVMYFNVFSTIPTFEEPMVIVVSVLVPEVGDIHHLIPIASYDQQMCGNGDGRNCILSLPEGGQFGNYTYAAAYRAGETVQLGIDPQSICRSLYAASLGSSAPFCRTKLMNPASVTSVSSAPLVLNFALFKQSDLLNSVYAGMPAAPSTPVDGPSQVILSFVSQGN
jgi:hypothetical protein